MIENTNLLNNYYHISEKFKNVYSDIDNYNIKIDTEILKKYNNIIKKINKYINDSEIYIEDDFKDLLKELNKIFNLIYKEIKLNIDKKNI